MQLFALLMTEVCTCITFFSCSHSKADQGSHPILRDLAQYDQPSLIQLEEAQNQLMQSMDKCFFGDYVSHLKGKSKRKKSAKKSEQDTAEAEKEEKAAKKCNTVNKINIRY